MIGINAVDNERLLAAIAARHGGQLTPATLAQELAVIERIRQEVAALERIKRGHRDHYEAKCKEADQKISGIRVGCAHLLTSPLVMSGGRDSGEECGICGKDLTPKEYRHS